jgi:hypothetical protein
VQQRGAQLGAIEALARAVALDHLHRRLDGALERGEPLAAFGVGALTPAPDRAPSGRGGSPARGSVAGGTVHAGLISGLAFSFKGATLTERRALTRRASNNLWAVSPREKLNDARDAAVER